jgi:hypothetical protein
MNELTNEFSDESGVEIHLAVWRVDRPEIVICRALPRFLSSQPCWNKKQPLSLSDVSGDWRGP